MRRKNQKWLPLVCVLAAVLVLLIVLALVLGGSRQPAAPTQTTAPVSTGAGHGNQVTQPSLGSGTAEDLVIQTPYATLIYPGQWSEDLEVEQVAGTEHDVNFYAAFDGMERIQLFSITFSPEMDGATMVIQDKDGNDVGVYLHMTEVTAALSDEQMNQIYAMQEAVNDLLSQLA